MAKASKYPSYVNAAGERLPSVTTIIGRFKDSGPLLYWANKVGREGLTLEQAREPAAMAGTMAHALVEAYLKDEEAPTLEGDADTVAKAKAAFEGFVKWQNQSHLEFVHVEVPLVSEVHRFGGRLDAIGNIGNELVLVDFKTSNSIYVDYLLQLGAYSILWNENYPGHPLVGGFHLLRFAKEEGDFAHHHFPKLDQEAAIFLRMRELYDIIKQAEKRVK